MLSRKKWFFAACAHTKIKCFSHTEKRCRYEQEKPIFMTRNRFSVSILLAFVLSAVAFAQTASLPQGAKIYIEAADGFDTYLTAALQKKKVPVTVVMDKTQADYELTGVSDHQKPGWAKIAFTGSIHSDEQASVKLINIKTSEVVFAYAVNKKNSLHGRQTAAEACAKHMKQAIEGN